MREMRAVSFVTQNRIVGEELPHVRIHSVADEEFMGALGSTSKYNADWDFLVFLHARDENVRATGSRKTSPNWPSSHRWMLIRYTSKSGRPDRWVGSSGGRRECAPDDSRREATALRMP
jgi:hypothetical protein